VLWRQVEPFKLSRGLELKLKRHYLECVHTTKRAREGVFMAQSLNVNQGNRLTSLAAAPLSVHNEEKHSSIATHLLRAVKTIGVRRRSDGCVDERKDPHRWKSDFYSWRYQLLRFPIGISVWWRLVEAKIHELYADYGSLVAARTNILCAD
jgi:hypothetical protein